MFAAGFTTLIREASDLDQPWTSLNKVAWWLYDKNGSVVMYITWSAFFFGTHLFPCFKMDKLFFDRI